MKSKIIFAVLLLILATDYSFGQSITDFEKKYDALKYYEIRPFTLVSPAFDSKGQICRAEIIPFPHGRIKGKNTSTDFVDVPISSIDRTAYHVADTEHLFPITILSPAELKKVFDELVPVQTRKGKGVASVDFSGFGARYTTKFKFENVTVNAVIVPKEKAVFSMKAIGENLDLFFNPPYGLIESAAIIWTERKCSEN
jgi:hypothetical protein